MNTDVSIDAMRVKLCEIGRMLFERQLTDAAGGNISARVGDLVCLSASYAGQKHQWRLSPEQILVMDLQGNKLEGEGSISRETKVHMRLYRDFPEGNAVIHSHPRNVLVFCAAAKPIPPVLEATQKFGEIKVTEFAPAHSAFLAQHVAEAMAGQNARIAKHAAAVIAPWHGIFCMGKDIDMTFDAVERIDVNARCILYGQLLNGITGAGLLEGPRQALVAALAAEGH